MQPLPTPSEGMSQLKLHFQSRKRFSVNEVTAWKVSKRYCRCGHLSGRNFSWEKGSNCIVMKKAAKSHDQKMAKVVFLIVTFWSPSSYIPSIFPREVKLIRKISTTV
jgi:hypothetical protein